MEVETWVLEFGSWELELASLSLEVGSWELEVETWVLEVGRKTSTKTLHTQQKKALSSESIPKKASSS